MFRTKLSMGYVVGTVSNMVALGKKNEKKEKTIVYRFCRRTLAKLQVNKTVP